MAAIVTSSLVEKSRSIVPVVPSAVPSAFCILTVSVNVFASNVEATPPVGKPVQFVNTPDVGVPKIGVMRVGDVAKVKAPEPVSSEHNVAICEEVEDVIPVIGKPVQLVRVPDAGVPSAGAVNVGEVNVLLVKVSVPARVVKSPSVKLVLYSAIVPFLRLAFVIFLLAGVPAGSSTIYSTSSSLAEVSSVKFCT